MNMKYLLLALLLMITVLCCFSFEKTNAATTPSVSLSGGSFIMPSNEGGILHSITVTAGGGAPGYGGEIDVKLMHGDTVLLDTGTQAVAYTGTTFTYPSSGSADVALTAGETYSFTYTDNPTGTISGAVYATFTPTWEVTFTTSGLDSSATGTVVTVNSVPVVYASLPYSIFVTDGASVSFTYGSTVSSSTTGKQFALYSGVSSPQTITGPTVISDTYITQYYLTGSTSHSSVIGAGWYDAGSTAYLSIASTPVYDGDTKRYVFASWSGSGSGSYTGSSTTATVTMNAPITETAVWTTQYYLNVVGVYASTTGSGWYNSGATASFNVSSPIDGGAGIRTAFISWTGSGSGSYSGSTQASTCTMNAAITETANWANQYLLTVTSSYGSVSGGGWYSSGATAYASLSSGTVSGGSGVQYLFASWSSGGTNYAASDAIVMSGPTTVSASWSTQFYLTVSSPYSTTSGAGWYNSGAVAYAGVATNIVVDGGGTHTLQGWSGGASGSGITSNAITMTAPKTATAVWSTTGSGGGGTVNYTAILHGPFFEDGTAASDNTVLCSLSYANGTIYTFTMNSSTGSYSNLTVASNTAFVQLSWNASSTLNYTRIYRFITGTTSDEINIYIPIPTQPSFLYSFSVTDFYGMEHPYLETRISPNGNSSYIVERYDLSEGGGSVTFVLTQYQMYSLVFVCDQGTYTQSFTASVQGTPGQYPVSLNVLSGNFPSANATSVLSAYAVRLNSSALAVSYIDPNTNTSWVYIRIYHMQGSTEIVDYVTNTTGNVQFVAWMLAQSNLDYYVDIEAYSGGVVHTWTLPFSSTYSSSNPFLGLFDWLGNYEGTLPSILMGWPLGFSSAEIAQLIGSAIVMLFLCIGSFRNAGASCIIAWIACGIMLYLGWYQGGTVYAAIPEFALALFLSVFIAIDEGKQTVREV